MAPIGLLAPKARAISVIDRDFLSPLISECRLDRFSCKQVFIFPLTQNICHCYGQPLLEIIPLFY